VLLIVGPCHSSELAGGKRSATGATDTLLSAQGQYEVLGHVTGRIGSMGRWEEVVRELGKTNKSEL
jgi:hypothetical protein